MPEQFDFNKHKADLYKQIRDRSAGQISSKHIRQFDHEFLKFSQAHKSMKVLEIGCGSGQFLRYLLHRDFKFVTGVDYDQGLQEKLQDIENAGYKIELSDAEAFIDKVSGAQFFDRIVLFDILEHMQLNDCVRVLRKLQALLTQDGNILIRVPNMTSKWGIRMLYGSFDHVTEFSPGRLDELAALTNFKLSEITGQTTGKRRKVFFQKILHRVLSHILPYHPEIWEAALICKFEKP